MNYYIGIDIGTTSVKTVAFAEDGKIIGSENIAYDIIHSQPGYSEQNADDIFEAIAVSLEKLSSALLNDTPLLISFSAAMHSMMAVDAEGCPLTHLIIWADNRASAIAEQLNKTEHGKDFYHRTGVPVHPMSPFCKLLWLKENDPALLSSAHKFIGIKEYIFFKLFGKYIVDEPIASATGLLNIHTLQWDETILNYAGIQKTQLSAVVKGTHTELLNGGSKFSSDKRFTPFRNTAFVLGGSDGALANRGSNATAENSMSVTIGTSAAVRIVGNEVSTDIAARTFCYYYGDGRYIIGGASNNGGVVMQWLKNTLLQANESYDLFLQDAEKIAPGCNGLVFIPYILGERAPVWNASAKGVFYGLEITHTRAHMIRSVTEAIVYAVYSIGKILMENRTITEIYVTGGFTQNTFWVQMLCDMFNCTVLVSGAAEGSATGAVLVGLEALGIQQNWKPIVSGRHEPDAKLHAIYLRQFQKFERIYEALANEMKMSQ